MREFWRKLWEHVVRNLVLYVMVFLLVALVLSWTVFRPERIIEKETDEIPATVLPVSTPTPTPSPTPILTPKPTPNPNPQPQTPTPTPTPVITEVTPQGVLDELARLRQEKATDQATIANLGAQITRLKAPAPAPTPTKVFWPKAALTITGGEARVILTNTFPNRKVTGAHFALADLYTLDQFKEIRSKMAALADNGLPRPSLIDKALGTFQEPGIDNLPIGWAYPTSGYDQMYLIVILQVAGNTRVFGFDPLEKDKIWEVFTDPSVEMAFVR